MNLKDLSGWENKVFYSHTRYIISGATFFFLWTDTLLFSIVT